MQKPIAVVGYSLRLPGCDNTDELWQALLEQRDLVTEVADDRWSKEAWQHPGQKHPGTSCTFRAGSLGDVSGFDAAFFGLSPREVSHMDPQQRLLLEMSWEAMERACIPPSTLCGTNTGVFIGIASVDYAYRFADDFAAIDANTGTGTASSIASNRISYLFDLKGPSVSMDTACSSSMMAFHQACQSILSGETDQALTGGISLHLHPFGFMVFSKATMLSPEGRCKVFDADGNGYARSEGGGVFLLKDYDKAVADGDPIKAVVAASAVNTDGYKTGLTVPSADAQTALMSQACERAGLKPDQMDYLEAHGTGTPVGDPIEARAISQALGLKRSKPLKIGSVKSNLGHLETASGVAGLAKALLSIEHRQLPATIRLNEPNPNIPFDEWNLDVVTETCQLPATGQLTIGVNSFGFGGANGHVILQSPPEPATQAAPAKPPERTGRLPLVLSARSADALTAMAERTAAHIRQRPEPDLYNLCWSARYRREQHSQALLAWVQSPEQAAEALEHFAAGEEPDNVFTGTHQPQTEGSVWVYSGNGCQWAGMGLKLLAESELVRGVVAEINTLIKQHTDDCDLEQLLGQPQPEDCYAATELAQPALFALQVATTRYLWAQGLEPAAVTGHSVGEVAAAWASGALTLEQATRVICLRSYYQGQTAGTGGMTAVATSAENLQTILNAQQCENVALAGINSPKGLTVAGPENALSQLENELQAQGIRFKRLNLNYAFHSPCMDMIEAGLKDALADLAPVQTRIPFVSTVTGKPLDGTELNAKYWWLNIRRPVLFESAIEHCLDAGHRTFLEIGAHPVLRNYINDCLRASETQGQVIATLAREQDSRHELQRATAQLMLSGASFDESRWFPVQGEVVPLPTYPWQRQRYWKPESTESLGLLNRYYCHSLLGYALAQHPGCWEAQLDTGRVPWLADHEVGDAVVFPGAGFAEITLAAAEQQLQGQGDTPQPENTAVIDIEQLEILSPLLLEENQSKVVRTRLNEANGDIQINARAHAQKDSDWQQHLKARWFAGSAGSLLARTAEPLPERKPDFTREQHLAAASRIGLDYGPAFQAMTEGWIEGQTVIARCQPSERIEQTLKGQLLHPGILDTAFQLFIPLLAQEQPASSHGYVPVQIGRLQFSRAHSGQAPAQIRVELKRRTPHSLLAEVELFDAEGRAMAVLTDVRFKAVALRKQQARPIALLDMPLQARPLPGAPSVLDSEALLKALQPWWNNQADDPMATEFEPLLDTLALAALNDTLSQRPVTLSQLGDEQKRWAENATDQGILTENENGQLQVAEPPEVGLPTVWELLLQEFPGALVPTHAIGRFGLHLADWLGHTGELPLINEQTWRSIYQARQNPSRMAAMRHELAEQLATQRASLAPGETLDMLEISAADADQWPPIPQKGTPQKTDLAIVHLDALRPSTLRQLLQQIRSALRADGLLLLMGQPHAAWLEQLMANQPELAGQEGNLQPDARAWCQLIEELGFERSEITQDSEQPGSAFLISARQPAKNASQIPESDTQTLIWADSQSERVAKNLAENLKQNASEHCPEPKTLGSLQELKAWATENHEQPARLILLNDTWAEDARAMATRRCAQLRDVISALETTNPNIRCSIITAGVNGVENSANTIAQAAVWGFTRTLMNETEVPLQLIDLPANPEQAPVAALAEAIGSEEGEDEQHLTTNGKRFVPRLREMENSAEHSGEHQVRSPQQALTLGFDQPGQLRNLRWQSRELPLPEEQQVVVEVKATGLNFRDVMYTLGLLSDEAIENGFSGPTLGLEFAGVVTAVGTGVNDFRPGDKVVGFGPSSFSTQVIAGSETLAHLPGEIGFEAAATIPTTFFTVYYSLKHLARLQPGERVLIHGAAGGVGLAAIQIARLMGAEIFATVGSPAKRDMVRLLGVEAIYDSRSHTFGEEIMEDTGGEGVDVVLNSLAGEAINQNFRVLRPFGRFLELGKRDFYENTAIGLRPFRNNISYFGVDSDQLMKVQPALTQTLFREMMSLFEQGELYPLPYTAFPATQVVEAFRYMQQARQIGKVVVNYPQPPQAQAVQGENTTSPQTELTLPADKTFLVTGGLGGFGLRTAQWLVQKGARHLALVSRRGKAEGEDAIAIEQLAEQGVSVQAYACDVSNREQLAQTLGQIKQQQPPLGGVVHAAAVFADALVQNLTNEQIEQVLAAKAFGAQYLHELTAQQELELFVLFSSATTLFGNPGQANYVGANLALEALTQLRRAQGQTATCVRWGAIDDAGYLARNTQIKQALQSRMGGNALTADKALAVLEQMLVNNQPLLGVMEFDWPALARFLPKAGAPRYQLIASQHQGSDHDNSSDDLLAELLAMAPEARGERITEELTHSLGQILMLPAEQIDPAQSLYDLGFDSLMGVELITDIEERFGVQLPAMAISESPSISKLTDKLLERIENREEQSDDVSPAQLAAQHGVSEHEVNNA
ncbi:MAG: SDR family NAD(P)-dependent oxidoreductase [Alteromonadaceae bacterium]|nr:SDR family NAD(P)-dependent oxidoreductase [Alteromonadaceae bacterium]